MIDNDLLARAKWRKSSLCRTPSFISRRSRAYRLARSLTADRGGND